MINKFINNKEDKNNDNDNVMSHVLVHDAITSLITYIINDVHNMNESFKSHMNNNHPSFKSELELGQYIYVNFISYLEDVLKINNEKFSKFIEKNNEH